MTRVYLVRPGPATERIAPVRRNITRVVPKTPASRVPEPSRNDVSLDNIEDILNDGPESSGPRRRERLNHLTQEEKMNRRKLKNRVAAQTARDRKKVRSQKLEDVVRDLLAENKRLREENSRLSEENKKVNLTVESAAFINAPLPWDQVKLQLSQILLLLTTLYPKKSSPKSSKISRPILFRPYTQKELQFAERITKKDTHRLPAALTRHPRTLDRPRLRVKIS